MAPRSFPEIDRARAPESAALSQSKNAVPRNRAGEAPGPLTPISGAVGSCTPATLRMMPVCTGQRPDRIVECPGAVSVVGPQLVDGDHNNQPGLGRGRGSDTQAREEQEEGSNHGRKLVRRWRLLEPPAAPGTP